MKLRTKFILVLLAMLVMLTGANLAALVLIQDQIVAQERANVEQTANRTAEQIEKTLNIRKDRVGAVGNQYPYENLSRSAEFARTFIDNSNHFYIGTVTAPNGTTVAAVGDWTEEGRQQTIGSNVSGQKWFQAAMTGRIWAEQQTAPGRGRIVAISGPLWEPRDGPDPDNETDVIGVISVAVEVDAISFFSQLAPLETDRQTVRVTDGTGRTLRGPQKTFNNSINGSATVDNLGWKVTVSRDTSQIRKRQQWFGLLQGASLLLVFGAVVGFGGWDYRSNLKQTERLLEGFESIKGGDYGYRLSLSSAEEWRQIGEGFNDLARGLAFREAQLLEREQRLGVLNRVLRHNVRNEMSVILNYAQLIQETTTDDQAATAADTIVDTGRKLADLSEKARQIEEALDSADEGLVEQDLVQVAEEVVAAAQDDADEADVVFEGPDRMTAAAIPSLKVAVENIVENAVEHNDHDEPRVELALGEVTRDGEDRVVLKVADNGPGIPEQEKNVLVQGRETALEHGSGLGLWLIYWVVDKSEGNLHFEENDPRGSVVSVELHAGVPEEVTPTEPIDTDRDPGEIEPELPEAGEGDGEGEEAGAD